MQEKHAYLASSLASSTTSTSLSFCAIVHEQKQALSLSVSLFVYSRPCRDLKNTRSLSTRVTAAIGTLKMVQINLVISSNLGSSLVSRTLRL